MLSLKHGSFSHTRILRLRFAALLERRMQKYCKNARKSEEMRALIWCRQPESNRHSIATGGFVNDKPCVPCQGSTDIGQ